MTAKHKIRKILLFLEPFNYYYLITVLPFMLDHYFYEILQNMKKTVYLLFTVCTIVQNTGVTYKYMENGT
jgi:hypothetical protein